METPGEKAQRIPFVAAVVPCRNEAAFIRPLLESLLSNSHPRERFEIIFVDGMSTDGTRPILEEAAREHAFIRILDNPRLITPVALNLGIKASKADIIIRIDAHAEYPPDYIARCVRLMVASGPKVGNVGGRSVAVPNGDGPWARAVAFVTVHRFGVGNARYKISSSPAFVDTVALGTFPRKVLDEVGLFDERLTRNQDHELNARIRKAGYAIAYDPQIRMLYRNKATLKGIVRHGFISSTWNVYTLFLHPYTWKLRRFVPAFFVTYLVALVALAAARSPWTAAASLPLGLYAVLVAVCSYRSGREGGGRGRVAATFVAYHLAFGAGSLFGLANLLTGRWRGYLGRPLRK